MSDLMPIRPGQVRPIERGDGRQSSASATMFSASTAASASAQDATGDGVTVTAPVPRQPTDNGSASGSRRSVDSTSTKPNTTATTSLIARCEHCGREFTPRRSNGRYCNPYCRRRAWLERNPDKAAELAVKDKARLKAYIIERGGVWIDEPARVEGCVDGA
jgi:hypothetical protein